MARQETQNTFSEGLISDLNPVNVPNTALTDCLNGTIITYDGNEYSLQNDKGNYALQECKLQPNYIPVGLKEYADILYIVSYNPLDGSVEIGSHPSTEQITDSSTVPELKQSITSIKSQIQGKTTNYSEIAEKYQSMQFFYGTNPERCKLYPNDRYQLIEETSYDKSKYEYRKYFIIDENRNLFDISDNISKDGFPKTAFSDYKYVSWENPGWIGIQPIFSTIDDFKVNIKKLVAPSYSDKVKIQLNFQLTTSDENIIKYNPRNQSSDLNVDYKIVAKKSETDTDEVILESKTISLTKTTKINSSSVYFYYNTEELEKALGENKIIIIEATPYLQDGSTKIIFDKNIRKLVFNISNKGSAEDLEVGNTTWQYKVDTDTKKLIVKFNTGGLNPTAVLDSDAYLFYDIINLNGSFVKDKGGNEYKKKLLVDWNLEGETITTFDLVDYTAANESDGKLLAENMYYFSFYFSNKSEWPSSGTEHILNTTHKFMVASELMNNQTNPLYDQIYFDEWFSNYNNSVKNKSFKLNSYKSIEKTIGKDTYPLVDTSPKYSANYSLLTCGNNTLTGLNKLVPYLEEVKLGNELTVSAGITFYTNFNYSSEITLLKGPLWRNLLSNARLKSSVGATNVFSNFNFVTGKTTENYITNYKFCEVLKTKPYNIIKVTTDYTLWNYTSSDVKINGPDDYKIDILADESNSYSNKCSITGSNGISGDSRTISYSKDHYGGRTNITPSTYTSLKNKISNKTKDNIYDCLFSQIRIGLDSGANKYQGAELYVDDSKGGEKEVYLELKSRTDPGVGWSPIYKKFIVFKDKGTQRLLWVPCETEYTTVFNFMTGVKHIEGQGNAIKGAFYQLEEQSLIDKKEGTYEIAGEVVINGCTYNEKNLLKSDISNGRESLLTIWDDSPFKETLHPNLLISNNPLDNCTSLSNIELSSNSGDINMSELITQAQDEAINTVINAATGAGSVIADHNNTVASQMLTVQERQNIYFSGKHSSTSNIYEDTSGTRATIVGLLNGETSIIGTKVLYGGGECNTNGKTWDVAWEMGYCNNHIKFEST